MSPRSPAARFVLGKPKRRERAENRDLGREKRKKACRACWDDSLGYLLRKTFGPVGRRFTRGAQELVNELERRVVEAVNEKRWPGSGDNLQTMFDEAIAAVGPALVDCGVSKESLA